MSSRLSSCQPVTPSPRHPVFAILALYVLTALPGAQGRASPHAAVHAPAPLLYARFVVAGGARVTIYQGRAVGRELVDSATLGLRPGYIDRVKLDQLPDHPGLALFPSLEVRGTLHLPPHLRAGDYPAPVLITEDDIRLALAGGLVTKVVYLENPERAQPVATRPDQPVEITLAPNVDPVDAARTFGRPMLILRLGARVYSLEEMAQLSIPGTILLPGENTLGLPPVPPCIPWAGVQVYDPIVGPRPPEEECMHDGGDTGLPVGLDPQGQLHGLDPSDTVAEYTDCQGQKHLAISNRVCLCVPRFAIIAVPIVPAGYESTVALARTEGTVEHALLRVKQGAVEVEQAQQLAVLRSRERASSVVAAVGTLPVSQIQGTAVVIGLAKEQTVVGTLEKKICPPARPLVLCKTTDKQAVQIGEVVTFSLTYTNAGGQSITNVVVSDSLTGRLEYVPGSAQSDRQAVFTTEDNEAGSRILRWEIGGRLLPGDRGLVRFQARVR